jgi:hypothetical protein
MGARCRPASKAILDTGANLVLASLDWVERNNLALEALQHHAEDAHQQWRDLRDLWPALQAAQSSS